LVVGNHPDLGAWNPDASRVELRRRGPLWREEWKSGLGNSAPQVSPYEVYISDCASPHLASPHSEQDMGAEDKHSAHREPVVFKFVVRSADGTLRWEDTIGDRMLPADAPWIGSVEVFAEFNQERPASKMKKALVQDLQATLTAIFPSSSEALRLDDEGENDDRDEDDADEDAEVCGPKARLRDCLVALGVTTAQERAVITKSLGANTVEDVCLLAETSMENLSAIAHHCTTPMQLVSVKSKLQSRAHVEACAGNARQAAWPGVHVVT